MDREERKAAAMALARELYELMPGSPAIGSMPWDMIEITKHYNFCRLIAERIIQADARVFK